MANEEQDNSGSKKALIPTSARGRLGLLGIATVVLGGIGTMGVLSSLTAYSDDSILRIGVESFFASLGFLVLNSGPYPVSGSVPLLAFLFVIVGRTTGAFFFGYTAYLGYKTLFAERYRLWRIRLRNQWDRRTDSEEYIIVCGIGEKGYKLARDLQQKGHDVVAIEITANNAYAKELSDKGVAVLQEDATSKRVLGRRAQAHHATEVFINCGSDRLNAKVIETLGDWLYESSNVAVDDSTKPIQCNAHVKSQEWKRYIQDSIDDQLNLRLNLYDTANATARELLHQRPVSDFDNNPNDGRTHIALIGWSDLTRALTFQLCEIMHYLEGRDRAITIACRNPDKARQNLYADYPALDPQYWDDKSYREFVENLFPNISFIELPVNVDVLLSDKFDLYNHIKTEDSLTIIVADDGEMPSGSQVSTMIPRLEELERKKELDTEIHYFADTTDNHAQDTSFRIESERVNIRPFSEFVDKCTPRTVRGEHRDAIAKRMALFFHLRYDYNPTDENATQIDQELADQISIKPPDGQGYDYARLAQFWDDLSDTQMETLTEIVWRDLSETNRDSNRHAADHIQVKHHLKISLEDDYNKEEIVRKIATVEHQRWCAERLLDGWEPLPKENADRWKSDSAYEQMMRDQKYHLDIRPINELNRIAEEEGKKDHNLVRFVLDHIDVQT
ncbi:MAG: NAD-binding protein [Halobacteriaceae archaeon]